MADSSARARELATLAHLELSADDAATFGAQLETVLGYLANLQTVDVEGTPEYPSAEHPCSSLREDKPGPRFDADRALEAAPALRERLIAVPKAISGRSPG